MLCRIASNVNFTITLSKGLDVSASREGDTVQKGCSLYGDQEATICFLNGHCVLIRYEVKVVFRN